MGFFRLMTNRMESGYVTYIAMVLVKLAEFNSVGLDFRSLGQQLNVEKSFATKTNNSCTSAVGPMRCQMRECLKSKISDRLF